MTVEVACPSSVNCSNATAFLSAGGFGSGACSGGPLEDDPEELRWIGAAPFTVIPSPSHSDIFYAEPFGHLVDVSGDTIMVASPAYNRLTTFVRLPEYGFWDTSPAAVWEQHDDRHFARSRRMVKLSNEALVAGTFKDTLAVGGFVVPPLLTVGLTLPDDEQQIVDDWMALGAQKAFIFPRSSDGAWGVEGPLVIDGYAVAAGIEGPLVPSGFGVAVGVGGDYVVVGSKDAMRAFVFERAGGAWSGTAAQIIFRPDVASFGQMVAVDGEGTAFFGCPDAGSVVIYERTDSGEWFPTYTLSGPPTIYPSAVALSGGYAVVTVESAETVYIFERQAGPFSEWELSRELTSASASGPNSLFGFTVAVDDRGGGNATVVVGAPGTRQALLWRRNAAADDWDDPLGLVSGGAPQGFGRSVGVSGGTVAVGSDAKRVYVFTEQLVGMATGTPASVFQDPSANSTRHRLVFDGRRLVVGTEHTVCVNVDGEGFRDVGLYGLKISLGNRILEAEDPERHHAVYTTTTTTTTPCADLTGWEDSVGNTCADYDFFSYCDEFGDCCENAAFPNHTARTACCVCGRAR